MAKWRIAWTQVVGDAGELHHVDEVEAPNAAVAISRWGRASWCNARVEAVWRVGAGRFYRKRKGENSKRTTASGEGEV